MMTDWDVESFRISTTQRAAELQARGGDVRSALAPLFQQAAAHHPEEEDRLLELWDRLTSRPVL